MEGLLSTGPNPSIFFMELFQRGGRKTVVLYDDGRRGFTEK